MILTCFVGLSNVDKVKEFMIAELNCGKFFNERLLAATKKNIVAVSYYCFKIEMFQIKHLVEEYSLEDLRIYSDSDDFEVDQENWKHEFN